MMRLSLGKSGGLALSNLQVLLGNYLIVGVDKLPFDVLLNSLGREPL